MSTMTRCTAFILIMACPVCLVAEEEFDAESAARELLNDATEGARRDLLVTESAPHAAAVIGAMTKDMPKEQEEEYRRIPWIWRVAVAAGRENNEKVLLELLEASLPEEGKPLDDWRAVVIGGGIVNGVSQAGEWPAQRLLEIVEKSKSRSDTSDRWVRTVELAALMVENEETPMGTRYDALRILGASSWKTHHKLISKYLVADANEELQMGAVSAAGDLEDDAAAQALIDNMAGFTETNRVLAIDALLRGFRHPAMLRAALKDGTVEEEWLSEEQRKRLEKD